MKINSHNEWDRLREVIVGTADGGVCFVLPSSDSFSEEKVEKIAKLAGEAYPRWLMDEASEDLDGMCVVLKSLDVKVHRPNNSVTTRVFRTPYFAAAGDVMYNIRDLHLVVGNTVIQSPSQEKHRYFEPMGFYDIWYQYFQDGFRWITAPRPRLTGEYMISYSAEGKTQYPDGQKYMKLTENEILFEAANTVRMGRDLLFLVSRSGNYLGAKWLQSVLGDEYRVHTTEKIYRSSHIDSTVVCLRPGLVLMNGERVTEDTCPQILDKWDKIYFHDVVPPPPEIIQLYEKLRKPVHHKLAELSVHTNLDSIASKWVGMNVLSIDQQTVLIDERQIPLMRLLEKHRITPVPVRLRHACFMLGGLHCSTLDTVRDSKLESYCD